MTVQRRSVHACTGRAGATPRHLQLTLPACGQPVRLARQVTREVLCAWRLADVEETAVLLVSELVSNVVRHANGGDVITLELKAIQTCLRIEAYRCQPGLVAPRSAGEFDDLGFGCALVESLARNWGVRETVTGTIIWAELDT
ncbi:MAG TPA: ATP-binding protein [Trebonia sp.]|jgi:anti-sigma regulatory factor (Ser/Thr protein kinase)